MYLFIFNFKCVVFEVEHYFNKEDMKRIIFCVLITTAIVTYVVHYGSCTDYNDESLSEETRNRIAKMPPEFQNEALLIAKRNKHKGPKDVKELRAQAPFMQFQCAVNVMKIDLENAAPEFVPKTSSFEYRKNLQETVPFPEDLVNAEKYFNCTENHYGINSKFRAYYELKIFFYGMLTFLMKHDDMMLRSYLTEKSKKLADDLRNAIFQHHKIDPTDKKKEAEALLRDFSSSYARIRHGCNGLHHTYINILQTDVRGLGIAEMLAEMYFLQAWAFTEADLVNLNILHQILRPTDSPYTSAPYSINSNLPELNGKESLKKGILPQKSSNLCKPL